MNIPTGRQVRAFDAFSLLMLVVFTTELAVMEIFAPLFLQLGRGFAAVADATLLVIIASLPLVVIFSPVFIGQGRRDDVVRRMLGRAFLQMAAGFFVAELLVMLVLPGMLRMGPSALLSVADATLTTLLVSPLLWSLLNRLEREHLRVTLADLIESPLLLYFLLLYIVFLAGLLHEVLLPDEVFETFHEAFHLANAVLLTLIIAPFLWLFVARPLRRSLQSERARARAVYQQVIDAVLLADTTGEIMSLNPAAQRIFGYPETELVGRPLRLLFADQQSVEPLLRTVAEGRGVGVEVSRELTGRHRDGGSMVMDVSVSRIQMGGREDYLLIMRDISERKENERALRESDLRFRQIYEQSEDAILFFKPGSTYIVDVNTTTERLFGFNRSKLHGQGLALLFPEGGLLQLQATFDKLKESDSVQLDSLVGRRSDGSEFIVNLRAKLMTLQGVELIYCTMLDITDRVRMEQEARDMQARLIQANKMTSLGLMVSGVSHEINNPNNFIMANAQILAGCWEDARKVLREYYRENGDFLLGGIPFSELDDQTPHLLSEILDGSRRINQIVGNLKKFARPDRGILTGVVDINQVVSSAIAILQHELMRHTDNFRCELSEDHPRILGNSQQIGQVVLNLLLNASQALPSRKQGIRISTGIEPATSQVTITVEDKGCGISAEDSRQIMEPFFTTKLDHGGTGLGLWICKSIVAEHRGTLEFVSMPGEGSTFTVKIPAADAAAEDVSE